MENKTINDVKQELIKLESKELINPDDGSVDNEFDGVVFELVLPTEKEHDEIAEGLSFTAEQLSIIEQKIELVNVEINNLTNNADALDYTIAVASGILTGLIDSFFVGELGLFEDASDSAKAKFQKAKDESHVAVNKFIEKYAKMRGYEPKKGGGSLKGAVEFLENKFAVAQDNTWKGQGISSTKTHHLDDLAHHPTLMGLIAAVLAQFFRIGFFASKDGKWHPRLVETSLKDFSCWIPIVITAVLKWLSYVAEKKGVIPDEKMPEAMKWIVKNIHKVPIILKLAEVADNWCSHLVSDMAGSKSSAGGGAGIPGLFISFLKEISLLPGLKNTGLPKLVNDLYASKKYTLDKVDLRTELAVFKEQSLPIIVNEVIVRTFYFVRRLITEYSEHKALSKMDWRTIIPIGNRTIARMMVISSATFTAVDVVDAGIRAVVKSGGLNPETLRQFVLRINFVGVGRQVVALGTDVGMGLKKSRRERQRFDLVSKQLALMNVNLSYRQADMWVSAKDTGETISDVYQMIVPTMQSVMTSWNNVDRNVDAAVEALNAKRKANEAVLAAIKNMYEESE